MGNSIGIRGKKAKVMKINGETFKLKTPLKASEVVKDYPGYVLLDSEAVKHFGIRAQPLEPDQELKPKKIYFLVEPPKLPEEQKELGTRRVRSGINMSAKDRLECLMLSRRTASDLTLVRPSSSGHVPGGPGLDFGPVRVKVRLPKAQVEKIVENSKNDVEIAEKIIGLYMENSGEVDGSDGQRQVKFKPEIGGNVKENLKVHKKRVSFVPDGGEIQLAQ